MSSFTIRVDADSCPASVREMIIRFAERLKIKAVFTANRVIPLKRSNYVHMEVAENLPDAADNQIVAQCGNDDIVITRDIPLAQRLVDMGITVLNDRGILYTAENIRERLSIRNFNLGLYEQGIAPEKTDRFGKKELNLFANSLDKELQKKLKKYKQ